MYFLLMIDNSLRVSLRRRTYRKRWTGDEEEYIDDDDDKMGEGESCCFVLVLLHGEAEEKMPRSHRHPRVLLSHVRAPLTADLLQITVQLHLIFIYYWKAYINSLNYFDEILQE